MIIIASITVIISSTKVILKICILHCLLLNEVIVKSTKLKEDHNVVFQ